MSHHKGKTMKHEHGKSQHVKTCQRLGPTFVIASQASKTRHPRERAFNDPSAGQQNEASLGLWQLDHFQAHPVSSGGGAGWLAGVSLIHVCQFDMVSRFFLYRCGKKADLSSIL